jgi:hypothetical protein
MMLMDSARSARVTDASGDSGLGLHQPGFRISNACRRDMSIYDQYDAAIASEYKNHPPTGEGSGELRGAQPNDICTINGSPGHLKMINGKLVCVPDLGRDANDDPRQAAIDAYDLEIANRWRGSGR